MPPKPEMEDLKHVADWETMMRRADLLVSSRFIHSFGPRVSFTRALGGLMRVDL